MPNTEAASIAIHVALLLAKLLTMTHYLSAEGRRKGIALHPVTRNEGSLHASRRSAHPPDELDLYVRWPLLQVNVSQNAVSSRFNELAPVPLSRYPTWHGWKV